MLFRKSFGIGCAFLFVVFPPPQHRLVFCTLCGDPAVAFERRVADPAIPVGRVGDDGGVKTY